MNLKTIRMIARQELTVNIRNKWTMIFAGVFGVLITSISYAGIAAEGFSGMQNFTRTSVSILNLVLYIVPLVALIMGTLSFTGDNGSMEMLYAQPVLRGEVVLGKLAGLFVSMALSMVAGFAAAGSFIAMDSGMDGLIQYALFVVLSLMLALSFLSISVVAAFLLRRKLKAFGTALFLWFFFVLFYDVIALSGSLVFSGQSANRFLFLSLFGNPVDMVRVAALIVIDNVTIFGAAGAALLRFLGGGFSGAVLLFAALCVWIALPIAVSLRLIERQDI